MNKRIFVVLERCTFDQCDYAHAQTWLRMPQLAGPRQWATNAVIIRGIRWMVDPPQHVQLVPKPINCQRNQSLLLSLQPLTNQYYLIRNRFSQSNQILLILISCVACSKIINKIWAASHTKYGVRPDKYRVWGGYKYRGDYLPVYGNALPGEGKKRLGEQWIYQISP